MRPHKFANLGQKGREQHMKGTALSDTLRRLGLDPEKTFVRKAVFVTESSRIVTLESILTCKQMLRTLGVTVLRKGSTKSLLEDAPNP